MGVLKLGKMNKEKRDKIEEIVSRGEKLRGYKPLWLRFMGEVDFDFLKVYQEYHELICTRSVHLPLKFKELITISILAREHCELGLRDHIPRAFKLGVTKEEIVEALQTASLHTGALTLVFGLKILIEILEKEEQNK